ncbi:hypothetical protein Tco_0213939 [Tanacetum coccineum]
MRTWARVAPRPKRQQVATAGALGAAEGAPVVDEGAQAVLAPVQAPQPPPPAPQPRTMSQRINRLEEEVRKMRQSVVGLQGVVKSSIIEQTRVSTWMISCMRQLMDASGRRPCYKENRRFGILFDSILGMLKPCQLTFCSQGLIIEVLSLAKHQGGEWGLGSLGGLGSKIEKRCLGVERGVGKVLGTGDGRRRGACWAGRGTTRMGNYNIAWSGGEGRCSVSGFEVWAILRTVAMRGGRAGVGVRSGESEEGLGRGAAAWGRGV